MTSALLSPKAFVTTWMSPCPGSSAGRSNFFSVTSRSMSGCVVPIRTSVGSSSGFCSRSGGSATGMEMPVDSRPSRAARSIVPSIPSPDGAEEHVETIDDAIAVGIAQQTVTGKQVREGQLFFRVGTGARRYGTAVARPRCGQSRRRMVARLRRRSGSESWPHPDMRAGRTSSWRRLRRRAAEEAPQSGCLATHTGLVAAGRPRRRPGQPPQCRGRTHHVGSSRHGDRHVDRADLIRAGSHETEGIVTLPTVAPPAPEQPSHRWRPARRESLPDPTHAAGVRPATPPLPSYLRVRAHDDDRGPLPVVVTATFHRRDRGCHHRRRAVTPAAAFRRVRR